MTTKTAMTKYRTIHDEQSAFTIDWIRCYALDIVRNPVLLRGLVPDPEYTASRIAAALEPIPVYVQPMLLEAVA